MPNDGTPSASDINITDAYGNLLSALAISVQSHSLVEIIYSDPPLNSAQRPSNAYNMVDTGGLMRLATIDWKDGMVDTIQLQYVPEPSSVWLLATVAMIVVAASRAKKRRSV